MASGKLKSKHARAGEQVTLEDVASDAGVSTMTVSRAIRSPDMVRKDTLKRIKRSIKNLNYHPNLAARRLASNKSDTFAVIIHPGLSSLSDFFIEVLKGLEETIRSKNIDLLLRMDSEAGASDYESMCRGKAVDAFIFLHPEMGNKGLITLSRHCFVPVVIVSGIIKGLNTNTVQVNNAQGVGLAIDHLASLGHTRIAHIAGFKYNNFDSMERQSAYTEEVRARRLAVHNNYIQYGQFEIEGGAEAMEKLMTLPERPTAVFTGNDLMAIGAIRKARELGIKIPRDVSIVGFDDIETSALITPPLTTITQHMRDIGRVAAEVAIEISSKTSRSKDIPHESIIRIIDTHLVVRESSGPCPR